MFAAAKTSVASSAKHDAPSECGSKRTSNAPLTDSSHRSIMKSSKAMDSLSMDMRRWHSCGRKNSISS